MPPQCRRPLDRSTRPRQTRARLVHPGPGGRAGRAGDVLAGHPGRTAGHSPGCPRPPLAVGQRPRCCCCGRAWQRSVPAFLPGAGRHRRAAGAVPGVPAPSAAAAAIGSARAAVHPRQCRAPAAHGVADAGVGLACGCRAGDGIAARCGAEQRTAGAGIRFDAARAAHGRAVGCRAREPACPDAGRFHFAGGGRHADCRADGRKPGRSTGEHCADLAGAVAVAGEVAGADVPRAVAGLDRWCAAFAAAGGAGPAGAGNHGVAMAYADGVGRAGHRGAAGNRRDSVDPAHHPNRYLIPQGFRSRLGHRRRPQCGCTWVC
ncbi:hypothetical protein G6F31_012929 [Rhizopus arrhizus]|nr:hypothetical protein G6F31_012929 [Rhizopus arrhizus]